MTLLEIGVLLAFLAAFGAAGFFAQRIFALMQAAPPQLPPTKDAAGRALPASTEVEGRKTSTPERTAAPLSPATPTPSSTAGVLREEPAPQQLIKVDAATTSPAPAPVLQPLDPERESSEASAQEDSANEPAAKAALVDPPSAADSVTRPPSETAPAPVKAATELDDLFASPAVAASLSAVEPMPSTSATSMAAASAGASNPSLFRSAALAGPSSPSASASGTKGTDAPSPGGLFGAPGAPKEPMGATGSARISLFAPPTKSSESGAKLTTPALGKRIDNEAPVAIKPQPMPQSKPVAARDPVAERAEEKERYRKGLAKTRKGFVARLADLFRGKPKVTADLKEEIEEVLFKADIGAKTAQLLLERVGQVLDRSEIADADAVWDVIRQTARDIFARSQSAVSTPTQGPYVMLMIGVNGVGKTTTLGKLAARHARDDKKVLLVAGDTFRAAAQEQLDVWARRVGCEIHMGEDKADPSAVIFEGITRGVREGFDVILCDTAGRLHTRKELMDELEKIRRSAAKALSKAHGASDAEAIQPTDIFLALDATIGQNALQQAALFKETLGFTGLVLTKLDGTAKGGVVLGVCDELSVPIRYIGIGEAIDDLRDFDAETFVDALLSTPSDSSDA